MFIRVRKTVLALGLFSYYLLLVLCVISYHSSKNSYYDDGSSSIIRPRNLKSDHWSLQRQKGKVIFIVDPYPSVEAIIDDARVTCSIEAAGEHFLS